MRFPQHGFPDELTQMIHWRTDGNPLFMVNMVESLVAQGWLEQCGERWELRGRLEDVVVEIPESLRHIIEQQLERLAATCSHAELVRRLGRCSRPRVSWG